MKPRRESRDNHKESAMEARAILPPQHYFFQDWVFAYYQKQKQKKKIEFYNWVFCFLVGVICFF